MPKYLERELERLQRHLLEQAGAVERAVHGAIRALRDRDPKLAAEVVAGDDGIDEEENRLEDECLKVLAMYQPVAGDLRRVTAVMMINVDLERMADLAVSMAERALALREQPDAPVPPQLQAMADLTAAMVRQSLDAFVNLDAGLARAVCRLDDEVDRLNREAIAELVAAMKCDPAAIDACLSLFSAVRQLERIADHATNVAEDVVYLVEGEIVRHRPEALAQRGCDGGG
jgi:phosphate transport system protein